MGYLDKMRYIMQPACTEHWRIYSSRSLKPPIRLIHNLFANYICMWFANSANTQPAIVNRGCFTDPFIAQAKKSHSFRGQHGFPKWRIWLLQVSSHLKFSFWLLGVPPEAGPVQRTWPHQEGSSCAWLSSSCHSADCVAEPDPLGYGYFQGQLG